MIPLLFLALNLTRMDAGERCWVQKDGLLVTVPCSNSVALPDNLVLFSIPGPAVPVEKIADALATDLVILGAGVTGDLLSTAAFRHYCPTRCREGNPIVFAPDALVPLKLGSATAVGGTQYLLRRKGHRWLATAVRWVYFSINVLVTARNTYYAFQGE